MDIETLSASELVALAGSKGLAREIVGMTTEGVRDFLRENEKTEEPAEVEETQTNEDGALSWQDLKKLAKAKGINTYKKKRVEIEALLNPKEAIEEVVANQVVQYFCDLAGRSKQVTELNE